MWFCLRKSKTKAEQQNQEELENAPGGFYRQYPPGQEPEERYVQVVRIESQLWQLQTANQGHYIAEAPGCRDPVELSQGNYGARSLA